jgi:hypothetical protein
VFDPIGGKAGGAHGLVFTLRGHWIDRQATSLTGATDPHDAIQNRSAGFAKKLRGLFPKKRRKKLKNILTIEPSTLPAPEVANDSPMRGR